MVVTRGAPHNAMTGRTHDLAAFTLLSLVFVALPEVPHVSLPTLLVAFSANFVGGLFPDIDQPTSDFWDNFRLGPYLAKVICPALGGHRHISHSFLGFVLTAVGSQLLFTVLGTIVLVDMNIVWWCFMIGVASHYLTDFFTRDGLPLLWPLKNKFGFPPWRWMRMEGGSWVEHLLVYPSLAFFTGYVLYHHQNMVLQLLRSVR